MFNSLKLRVQSLFSRQTQKRRSASICVQSKAKKIQPKRDQSQKRANQIEEIEITPKKIVNHDTQKFNFDSMQTATKKPSPMAHPGTLMINNNKWLDLVSDIESSAESCKLLPTSQELRSKNEKSKRNSKQHQIPKQINRSLTLPETVFRNQVTCQGEVQQSQNTLINWLEQNKPEYFMIKLTKQSPKKENASDIKKHRMEEYIKQKKKPMKGKSKFICIVCQEEATIKESIQLACTHRIHKSCAEIIKWKPRGGCNLCERKSIKDLVKLRHSNSNLSRLSNLILKNKKSN